MKPSTSRNRGVFLNYIATRENVVKDIEDIRAKPATDKQQNLISELLKQYSQSNTLPECHCYLKEKTVGNASELITRIFEDIFDESVNKGLYVKYMAERPRVAKEGAHGLFGQEDDVDLQATMKELEDHNGIIWTQILSLTRKDAKKHEYESIDSWKNLIRSKQFDIAEQMKINPDHLKWYAAFHNEGYHPHIHLVIYSTNPNEGYLSKKGIDALRAIYAKEIFKQDLFQIYDSQTKVRNYLLDEAKQKINDIVNKIDAGGLQDDAEINRRMYQLSHQLAEAHGKKQYGYLKPELKSKINEIVVLLSQNEDISNLYKQWCENKENILSAYKDNPKVDLELVDNKEFKALKNHIIKTALGLDQEEKNAPKITVKDDQHLHIEDEYGSYEVQEREMKTHVNDIGVILPGLGPSIRLLHHLSKMIEHKTKHQFNRMASLDRKQQQTINNQKSALGMRMED